MKQPTVLRKQASTTESSMLGWILTLGDMDARTLHLGDASSAGNFRGWSLGGQGPVGAPPFDWL